MAPPARANSPKVRCAAFRLHGVRTVRRAGVASWRPADPSQARRPVRARGRSAESRGCTTAGPPPSGDPTLMRGRSLPVPALRSGTAVPDGPRCRFPVSRETPRPPVCPASGRPSAPGRLLLLLTDPGSPTDPTANRMGHLFARAAPRTRLVHVHSAQHGSPSSRSGVDLVAQPAGWRLGAAVIRVAPTRAVREG